MSRFIEKIIRNNNYCYIVGDIYNNFSWHKSVFPFSKIKNSINDSLSLFNDDSKIIFAQGIDVCMAEELKNALIKKFGYKENQIIIPKYFYLLEDKGLVHKKYRENVVITKPDSFHEKQYENYLYISGMPDIMRDHLTGMHTQGLLLYEAARQTITAIIERYLAKNIFDAQVRILQSDSRCAFTQFVFPFEIRIKSVYEITKQTKMELKGKFTSTFYQFSNEVCNFEIDFSISPEAVANKVEEVLLTNILSSHNK